MDNDKNKMSLYMTPECLGEALQDYLHKLEILPGQRDIVAMSIPVELDEDGNIPMILELTSLEHAGMN